MRYTEILFLYFNSLMLFTYSQNDEIILSDKKIEEKEKKRGFSHITLCLFL
jgi:hypothetical protein